MRKTFKQVDFFISFLVFVVSTGCVLIALGFGELSMSGMAALIALAFGARTWGTNLDLRAIEQAEFRQWWIENRMSIRAELAARYPSKTASEHFAQFPH